MGRAVSKCTSTSSLYAGSYEKGSVGVAAAQLSVRDCGLGAVPGESLLQGACPIYLHTEARLLHPVTASLHGREQPEPIPAPALKGFCCTSHMGAHSSQSSAVLHWTKSQHTMPHWLLPAAGGHTSVPTSCLSSFIWVLPLFRGCLHIQRTLTRARMLLLLISVVHFFRDPETGYQRNFTAHAGICWVCT